MKRQRIKIIYDGTQDDEIDTRIAAVLEHPPLNFEWEGQGFDLESKQRDISFTRQVETICDTAPYPQCNGANGCDTCENQPEE